MKVSVNISICYDVALLVEYRILCAILWSCSPQPAEVLAAHVPHTLSLLASTSFTFPACTYLSVCLQAVIASLGDVLSMFGLPCLFALYLLPMRRWESGMCRVLVVMATALSGLGMYSSIQQLIEAYQGKS